MPNCVDDRAWTKEKADEADLDFMRGRDQTEIQTIASDANCKEICLMTKLDAATAAANEAFGLLSLHGALGSLSKASRDWWAIHSVECLRESAIAKLTPEEIKALGIKEQSSFT